jgi:hypothetical protein
MADIGICIAFDGGATQFEFDSESSGYNEIRANLDGGWLEAVPLPPHRTGITAYCDEEGKLKGLPVNLVASALFGQTLNGNVVIVGYDGGPETVGLTDEQVVYYNNAISRVRRF